MTKLQQMHRRAQAAESRVAALERDLREWKNRHYRCLDSTDRYQDQLLGEIAALKARMNVYQFQVSPWEGEE